MTTDFADIASGSKAGGPTAVILFGPPGSGKGTLGRSLSQLTGWPHLAAGDILRGRIRNQATGDSAGTLQQQLAAGNFAPDDLVTSLVRERLLQPECRQGCLLDGFPRNLLQAETLLEWKRESGARLLLIHLEVEYNEMVVRLTGRRICLDCGAIYHQQYQPPAKESLCDDDGGKLTDRHDDKPGVMAHRWNVYQSQTSPVLAFFERNGLEIATLATTGSSPRAILAQAAELVTKPGLLALRQAR